jgi:hypothetical protein
MLGVILFSLIMLFYGFVLSTELFVKAFPAAKDFFSKVDAFFEKGSIKVVLSLLGILFGVWNLFAPDFGAGYSPTIIGALLPSLLLIADATIIYPNILEILNLPQESKDKYYAFIEKYKGVAGIATLVSGFLHMALFRQILF